MCLRPLLSVFRSVCEIAQFNHLHVRCGMVALTYDFDDLWLVHEGLNANASTEYFVVALENRVQSTVPNWFKERLRAQFFRPTGAEEPTIFPEEFNSEDGKRFANDFKLPNNKNNHIFGVKHSDFSVLLSTDGIGVCSDLYFVANGGTDLKSMKASAVDYRRGTNRSQIAIPNRRVLFLQ